MGNGDDRPWIAYRARPWWWRWALGFATVVTISGLFFALFPVPALPHVVPFDNIADPLASGFIPVVGGLFWLAAAMVLVVGLGLELIERWPRLRRLFGLRDDPPPSVPPGPPPPKPKDD